MRLAAQLKGGFYPAPPDAIAAVMEHVHAPHGPGFHILDPCAGEGEAIKQIAESLDCRNVCAIELDESRSVALRAALPEAQLCCPASFFGTAITYASFGFAWVNPPFDDEIGGGRRVESDFLERATHLLAPRGVLALVCPEDVSTSWSIQSHLRTWYEDLAVLPFPDHCRKYREVVVLGKRLAKPTDRYVTDYHAMRQPLPAPREGFAGCYSIPITDGPRSFCKTEPTDNELMAMLAASPLRQKLTAPKALPIPEPLLPLSCGHIAILLASGHLDGLVEPPDGDPHVVRGTARKIEYVVSQETTEMSGGGEKTVTIKGQKIQLVVRAVGQDGTIKTFEQQ